MKRLLECACHGVRAGDIENTFVRIGDRSLDERRVDSSFMAIMARYGLIRVGHGIQGSKSPLCLGFIKDLTVSDLFVGRSKKSTASRFARSVIYFTILRNGRDADAAGDEGKFPSGFSGIVKSPARFPATIASPGLRAEHRFFEAARRLVEFHAKLASRSVGDDATVK